MHERMLHGIFQDQDADGQPELFADLGGKIEHPLPLLVRLLTGTHAQRLSHGLPLSGLGSSAGPPGTSWLRRLRTISMTCSQMSSPATMDANTKKNRTANVNDQ